MEIPISSSGSCIPSSLLVFLVNSLLPAKNYLWTWPALDLCRSFGFWFALSWYVIGCIPCKREVKSLNCWWFSPYPPKL